MSGVVDNAVYPVLFLEYFGRVTDVLEPPLHRWLFVGCFVFVLTYLCHRGLDLAGRSAVALAAFVLSPFAVLAVLARAGKGCEIPNFKGSYLGRFPLVLADFWTSDHLSERSRP